MGQKICIKISDNEVKKIDLDVDTEPIENSEKLITSGGVYQKVVDLGDKNDASDVTGNTAFAKIKTLFDSFSNALTALKNTAIAQAVGATGSTFTSVIATLATIINRGSVSQTLNTSTTSYTIPAGYHDGTGAVSISTQSKSTSPSTSAQTISPDSGKVLSSVAVSAISPQRTSSTPNQVTTSGIDSVAPYVYFPYGWWPQQNSTYGAYVYMTAAQAQALHKHTATYSATSRSSAIDLGEKHAYRYINTSGVPTTTENGGLSFCFYDLNNSPTFYVSGMGGFTKSDYESLPNYAANTLVNGTKTYTLTGGFTLTITYSTNTAITALTLKNNSGVALSYFCGGQRIAGNTSSNYNMSGVINSGTLASGGTLNLLSALYNVTASGWGLRFDTMSYGIVALGWIRFWKR